jgi:probable F420-dependent oxidoreductase
MTASLHRFRFGVQCYHTRTGAEWLEAARMAEAVGYDILLMPDHFGPWFGPFAGLTAAAAVTSTLRVGTLVAANDFRHPLVLAKEAATLDLISAGRFELGLGAGWDGSDYAESGIALASSAERTERLGEAITVLKAAFSGERFSFTGSHYQISEHAAGPVPAQRPHPPLMIGAGAPKLLGLAAREADIVTLAPRTRADGSGLILASVSSEATQRKVGWVREAAGDRFDKLELGALVFAVEITSDPLPAAEALAARWDLTPAAVLASPHLLVGTVSQIADELLSAREGLGISYWVFQDPEAFAPAFAPVLDRLAGS